MPNTCLTLRLRRAALTAILALSAQLAAPAAFAQGVYETPPAPNSSQSMPQPPNSAPPSARTLQPGSTGTERTGIVATTDMTPSLPVPPNPGTSSTR